MISDENSRLVGVAQAIEVKKDDEMTCSDDHDDADRDHDRDRDKPSKKSNNIMYYCVIASILTIIAVMGGFKSPFTSQSASASVSVLRYTEADNVPIEDIDLFLVNSGEVLAQSDVELHPESQLAGQCPTDGDPTEYKGYETGIGGEVFYGLNFDCGTYYSFNNDPVVDSSIEHWKLCATKCNADKRCATFTNTLTKCYLHDKWQCKNCDHYHARSLGNREVVSGVCRPDYLPSCSVIHIQI